MSLAWATAVAGTHVGTAERVMLWCTGPPLNKHCTSSTGLRWCASPTPRC